MIENFIKYPKILRLEHDEVQEIFDNDEDRIVIQEKMDGANFRFYKHSDGYLVFGSRNQQLHEKGDHEYQKNFNRCIEYIKSSVDLSITPEGCIFYGECMIKHTLPYDWDTIPPFLGFDILTPEGFCHSDVMQAVFENIGLQSVPAITVITAKDAREIKFEDSLIGVTAYPPKSNPQLQAEGWAIKNETTGVRSKFVRDEFKEANAAQFGNDNVRYNGDEYAVHLVQKFCTNSRIDKTIFKYVDEGKDLDMRIMSFGLHNRVWNDIWEEEWKTIIFKDSPDTLCLKHAKKLVTNRCRLVLQQVITNNTLQSYEDKQNE